MIQIADPGWKRYPDIVAEESFAERYCSDDEEGEQDE